MSFRVSDASFAMHLMLGPTDHCMLERMSRQVPSFWGIFKRKEAHICPIISIIISLSCLTDFLLLDQMWVHRIGGCVILCLLVILSVCRFFVTQQKGDLEPIAE